jgi:hypothetical protein
MIPFEATPLMALPGVPPPPPPHAVRVSRQITIAATIDRIFIVFSM